MESTTNNIGSLKPATSLRFIILEHYKTEEKVFYFGKGQEDHAELEASYQKNINKEFTAIGGAFYTIIPNNKLIVDKNISDKTIYLFGKSGTFGLADWVIEEALSILKVLLSDTDVNIDYLDKR